MVRIITYPAILTSGILTYFASLFLSKATLSTPAITTPELTSEFISEVTEGDDQQLADSIAAKNSCSDIDGYWRYSTRGTIKCFAEGKTEKKSLRDSRSVNIKQNGCKISWKVDSYTRKGQSKRKDNYCFRRDFLALSERYIKNIALE